MSSSIATIGLMDGQRLRGQLSAFFPASLHFSFWRLDSNPFALEGEDLGARPTREQIAATDVAYIAFHRRIEARQLPELVDAKDFKLHCVGRRTFIVRVRLIDVRGTSGFFGYPIGDSDYQMVFFYPHGVNSKEDLAPLGSLVQQTGSRDGGTLWRDQSDDDVPPASEVDADGNGSGARSGSSVQNKSVERMSTLRAALHGEQLGAQPRSATALVTTADHDEGQFARQLAGGLAAELAREMAAEGIDTDQANAFIGDLKPDLQALSEGLSGMWRRFETEFETETETESESESETESESESEFESETASESETESESDVEIEAASETATDVETETGTPSNGAHPTGRTEPTSGSNGAGQYVHEIPAGDQNTVFLGNVLLDHGIVGPQQIEEALEAQRRNPSKRIGEILVEKGFISEEQLYQTLALKFHMPFINLEEVPINPAAVTQIEPHLRKRYQVLPIDCDEKSLLVVMSDPLANEVYDVLRFHVKKQVVEALATPTQIAHFLDIHGVDGDTVDEQAIREILGPDNETELAAFEQVEAEEEFGPGEVDESDNAIIRLANRLIIDAHRSGVSDIHIEPCGKRRRTRIRMRVDGECYVYHEIPARFWRPLVARLKIMARLDIAENRIPQDGKIRFRYEGKRVELRVATLPTVNGNEDVVMRVLASSKPIPLDKMGMSRRNFEGFTEAIKKPYGLILCVGPTGSGKTTTLHSALAQINTPDRKIWTAEDPVEITQDGLRQVQVQSKIGYTFAAALRAFLRADPDVVMVGEMRDQETARIGIQASLTGHMVFSTLHTNSAPETVTRLLDMGIDPFTFADALVAVLAQRLTRRICSKCAVAQKATQKEYDQLASLYGPEQFVERLGIASAGALHLWHGQGCRHCENTGYKGRVALHELLLVDERLKHAIESKASIAEVRDAALAGGMTTLVQDGIEKVVDGQTDLKKVLAVCMR